MDLRALPWRGQLPITVDITVPVQPAAEAGLPVGLGEISEVGFAEPRRQRAIGAGVAQKALAIFDEQGGWIGKSPPHHRRTFSHPTSLFVQDGKGLDRASTPLDSIHYLISYAALFFKKKPSPPSRVP